MPLDYPSSPSVNDVYSFSGKTWTWNGTAWILQAVPLTTANVTELTNLYYTDVRAYSNAITAGFIASSGAFFNTAINRNIGYDIPVSTAVAFAAPSTANIEYIVHSIHVTNISSGNAAEVSGTFDGTTYSSNINFSSTIPVPIGSSVELLKKPKVMQPSDKLYLNANVASTLHAVITYETKNSSSYFGSGVDITTAATYTTLYTANANCMIESILLTNDDSGILDVKARVVWTNASDTIQGYYCFDLVVPNDSTIELLETPKYLENGHKIRVYANQANRLESIISGKIA